MKNKLLLIFVLSVVFISVFTVSFCGYDFEYQGNQYTIANDFPYEYYVFGVNKYDNSFCVFVSDKPLNYYKDSSGYFYASDSDSLGFYCTTSFESFVNLDWNSDDSLFRELTTKASALYTILYSNYDVYVGNDKVFQYAPLMGAAVRPMEIQQVEEIPQEVIKVVKVILPVILAMMGIFLIIYLMRYKIFSHL